MPARFITRALASKRERRAKKPRIVVIGGGGGTAAIYGGIADWTPNVTAIVAMTDSGGSTGKLRKELDIPAPGDLRNVMVASSRNEAVKRLETHRFGGNGSLRGHSALNMVVGACIADFGPAEGVRIASKILQVPGTVLPVTLQSTQLKMTDGKRVIVGEHEIDVYTPTTSEPLVSIEPRARINPEAAKALKSADLIVIPAGSIYTSLLAALVIDGVAEILQKTRAPVAMLCNLATEQHQTDGWHVVDFLRAFERHGIRVDIVLYNNERPTREMLKNYLAEGQRPVNTEAALFTCNGKTVRFVGAPLLSHDSPSRNPLDPIKRGLMRHDAGKVVLALQKILAENQKVRTRAPRETPLYVGLTSP